MDLRPGDKVMQIENDYDKEVYNGDIGTIDNVSVWPTQDIDAVQSTNDSE